MDDYFNIKVILSKLVLAFDNLNAYKIDLENVLKSNVLYEEKINDNLNRSFYNILLRQNDFKLKILARKINPLKEKIQVLKEKLLESILNINNSEIINIFKSITDPKQTIALKDFLDEKNIYYPKKLIKIKKHKTH